MSFSGSLLDLSVADVLEFLSISQRSGVIRFNNAEHGEISLVLSGGKILSATTSHGQIGLTPILKDKYGLTQEAVDKALERQDNSPERKPIGSVLVEMGDLTKTQVEEAMVTLIESLANELVGWAEGGFEFEPSEVKLIDSVAHFPAFLGEGAEMDVRNVLMEAVRLFDETQRAREEELRKKSAKPDPTPHQNEQDLNKQPEPPPTVDESDLESALLEPKYQSAALRQRAIVTITDDAGLFATLQRHSTLCGWDAYHVHLVQEARPVLTRLSEPNAEIAAVGDLSVVALGNFGELGAMPGARRLREEYPHVPLLLIGDDISEAQRLTALRAGAHMVLDKPRRADEPSTYVARFERFRQRLLAGLDGAFLSASQAYTATRGINDELRSLRDRVLELRNRSARSTVSLSLLHHVAETTERAVLFLRRRNELVGIGAFGQGKGGQPVNDLIVGARFDLDDFPAIATCVETGSPYQGNLSNERGFDKLFMRMGRPITSQGLILPIKALDRVIAVVYGDNGSSRRPLITTDGLEILTTQTGLMLENILLKRGVDSEPIAGSA